MKAARVAALAALFFAALFGTARLVRPALALADADELQESGMMRYKLGYFDAHAADYDLVFVGSSRMFRQVAPGVFDAELAALGAPTRSYNLGMPGMWFYEVLYRAQRIARRAPDSLAWMVIELQDPDPDDELPNQKSQRTIAWHTPRFTWIACRTSLVSERSWLDRVIQVGGHLGLGFRNGLNAGFLTASLQPSRVPPEFREHKDLRAQGFMPLDFDPDERERHADFLGAIAADPRFLSERVEAFRAAPQAEPPAGLFGDLAWLVAELRGLGIEPIFVLLPPVTRPRSEIVAARDAGALPNLIDLEDPERYPEFYLDPALRFDPHHLNRAGAERLSRVLARACLPIVSAQTSAAPRRP